MGLSKMMVGQRLRENWKRRDWGLFKSRRFPGSSGVKTRLPIQEMQENVVRTLGWEDVTWRRSDNLLHYSYWENSMDRESGGSQSMES